MCKDYSQEVIKLIKKFMDNSWEFGKSEEIISHDFPQRLTYDEIKRILSSLKNPEFTHREKRDNEYRYTIYTKDSKYSGKTFVITFRNKNIRVITAFPMGRKTYIKYNRKKFKRRQYVTKI